MTVAFPTKTPHELRDMALAGDAGALDELVRRKAEDATLTAGGVVCHDPDSGGASGDAAVSADTTQETP